jgi:hypothetical protein
VKDAPSLADGFALGPAREGDWEALAQHIERGGRITPAMRGFLVAVLRGRKRPKKHRPRKGATAEGMESIAWFVESAKRNGARATKANEAAAKHFKVTTRTVQRAVKHGWGDF